MPASLYRTSAFGPAIPPRLVSGGVALFANGTGTAQFDHLRVTQYPDPSASMALAGRATSSVVNWNANIPSGTGLTTCTSLDDGATYQLATAATDIAGISTQLFSTLALQQFPKGYYRLDDTTDSSGNGYNGTSHGTLTTGVAGALQGPGETADTAMTSDGSTGYISLAGITTNTQGAFSFCFWLNLSTNTFSGARTVIANDTPGTSNNGFLCAVNANGVGLKFAVGTGTTNANINYTGTIFTAGTWYFIGCTWGGTTLKVYIPQASGNTAVATTSLSGSSVGTTTNPIGLFHNPSQSGDYLPGSLDEVLFFYNNPIETVLSGDDFVALYNIGRSGIGQVANDSFTADTHIAYTQTFGSGGSGATWTWDTAGSKLNAVGGNKAHLLYNNLWAYDIDLLGDFYQAENSGFVWGYQDNLNFYTLNIKDSNASVGPNTVTLFKTTAGTATQLATTSITWQVVTGGIIIAQVHHRFHVTMLSGVITVNMDENQILTYTDSSPFPAGLAGLRNDTGTSYIYLLAITPQPVDLSSKFIVSKHVLTTTSPTVTPQLTDHQAFSGDPTFGPGVLIPSADYRQTYVSDNVDELNTKSNYWWQVSSSKNIVFQPRNAKNSPYILQSTDILINTLPTVEYSGDLYRNRQTLKGVYDTATFDETRNGDGQTRTWNLSNPVVGVPIIALNGIVASVGIQGTDTGKQFYYQPNDVAITQDNSQPILQGGPNSPTTDVLEITYTGSFGIDFSLDNTGQFPNTLSQSQLAALDNTDGIIEAVEDVSSQNMNVAAATAYASTLLQRYGSIARTIKFDTLHGGLKPGHSLPIFIPQLNIFDSVFLVVEVNTSVRTIAGGNIQYLYSVVASEAAALSSWQKLFSRVMRSVTGTKAKV